MKNYRDVLRKITEILLDEQDNYMEIKNASDDLFSLFCELSGFDVNAADSREAVFLPGGKAISPFEAAACVKEMMRTKRFLKGIYKGIKTAKERFPGGPVHILYAGTGPFAALLLPLTAFFSPSEIRLTLLEINPVSISHLKTVIDAFGASEYVAGIIQTDAATYNADGVKPVHMVVTETMQRALDKEPQVSVSMNLTPQMEEGGILIPANISIDAVLLDERRDMERMRGVEGADKDFCQKIGRIFELNKATASEYSATNADKKGEFCFPEFEATFPEDMEERFNKLSLMTEIEVFEDERLTYMQCSLNMPKTLMDFNKSGKPMGSISFRYDVSEKPGFMYKIIT